MMDTVLICWQYKGKGAITVMDFIMQVEDEQGCDVLAWEGRYNELEGNIYIHHTVLLQILTRGVPTRPIHRPSCRTACCWFRQKVSPHGRPCCHRVRLVPDRRRPHTA
jgi:hypothetical protein